MGEASLMAVIVIDWVVQVLRCVIGMLDPSLAAWNASMVGIWGIRCVLLSITMHVVRRCMKQKRKLADQLTVFDVSRAHCLEGKDRDFIISSISRWYGCVDRFNAHVRGSVRNVVLSTIHGGSLTYRDAIICSFMVQGPTAFDYVLAHAEEGLPLVQCACVVLMYCTDVLFTIPLALELFFVLAEKFGTHTYAVQAHSFGKSVLLASIPLGAYITWDRLRCRLVFTIWPSIFTVVFLVPLTWSTFKGKLYPKSACVSS